METEDKSAVLSFKCLGGHVCFLCDSLSGSLFQAIGQWEHSKAGTRRLRSGRERGRGKESL